MNESHKKLCGEELSVCRVVCMFEYELQLKQMFDRCRYTQLSILTTC